MSMPAAVEDAFNLIDARSKSGLGKAGFRILGEEVVPHPKDSDSFWWHLLISCKPARSVFSTDSEQSWISEPSINKSQTPQEQCRLDRAAIVKAGFDADYVFGDGEAELDVVQINSTTNFLDAKAYTHVKMPAHRFMHFIASNRLVPRQAEVPQFLGYSMQVFSNNDDRCLDLHEKGKDKLRNQPATLLTIDKKTLVAACPLYGKAFVVAKDMDLGPEEVREIVIFCMGQSEALEYKLTSWDKLKNALQDDARKFALSSQHIRRRK